MFNIDKEKFGAFIAMLRREKGITQKELAEQLAISDKAVSKWETAVSVPNIDLLIPLADLLGVTVTELLLCRRPSRTPRKSRYAPIRSIGNGGLSFYSVL